jgi:hypothetical protein
VTYLSREELHILGCALQKAEREYRLLQPDADDGECWAEVEAAVDVLDERVPGWRDDL